MSTTQGIIRDLGHMLSVEGLPRIIVRLKERVLLTGDSSSKRTRLYSREQIEDIILKNSNTEVVETRNYLKGLSTYIVLKKSDKNKDF